ncbi:putative membrane protein; permease family [Hyphomicrobium sp. GJ21]|uniref:YeeE/YedE family protein n=1 Tax=Hyphomicrobium sp. GJ21 TaxID=113574 RepID=UPI000622B5E1|nr:YeeE/YedE family protein [Hyphomicrobium sp. GJ21]CEJ87029.1 putative membrane protein; permease family [Hyphomicrobium sp. GJ21]
MSILLNLVAGLIFGLGLVISGMANPAKVLNFLDVAGNWDPSLAFVMLGAIAVTATGFRFVLRRPKPLLDQRFHLPGQSSIDRPLVIGSAIFGLGWGLFGFCPGPAITSLGLAATGTLVFVPMMLIGIVAAALIRKRLGS